MNFIDILRYHGNNDVCFSISRVTFYSERFTPHFTHYSEMSVSDAWRWEIYMTNKYYDAGNSSAYIQKHNIGHTNSKYKCTLQLTTRVTTNN